MKFTYNWLNSHVTLNANLEKLATTLSNIGLEVENIVDKEKLYSQFLVAEIIEAQKHPNADTLKICTVSNGKENLQIVCGATNARAGIKVALAPVGSIIPQNGMVIKASKIRDVESHGMLCSAAELSLDGDSDGIMELNADEHQLGMNFADFAGLNDQIIDISITPNRGDCAALHGIARDIAAAGLGELSPKFHSFYESHFDFEESKMPFNVVIMDKDACQEISFCYIKDIDNASSVGKEISTLFNLLEIKSHTALVDISNFSMYEYGRPNHVYDADKIEGNITVRMSHGAEKFTSLEGKEYTLDAGVLVVADEAKILSIAGVIGGNSSKVDENTKNIIVEVANFNPEQVAKSARVLNIKTESSFRFERRIDHGNTPFFMQYITELIHKCCGGKKLGSILLKGAELEYIKKLQLDYTEIEKILGIEIDQQKTEKDLANLGFTIESDSNLLNIPTWRQGDIIDNADIAEEIIRLAGIKGAGQTTQYDYAYSAKDLKSKAADSAELFRNVLTSRNANEIISWSFINESHAQIFTDKPLIKLANPISSEFAAMRCSIIPGLLQIVKNNTAKGQRDLSLFEVGKIFHKDADKEVVESNCLAVVRVGNAIQKNIFSAERKFDFYDAKDDLYALLNEISISEENLIIKKEARSYHHPGKSASFYIGKQLVACVGELHPKATNYFGIKERVNFLELFYDNLPQKNLDKRSSLFLSELQSVSRDFAFFIDDAISSEKLIKAIKSLKIDVLSEVNIFDVYKDTKLDNGKKSIAFNIKLQPKTQTLIEAEIDNISDQIIRVIKESLKGELRDK